MATSNHSSLLSLSQSDRYLFSAFGRGQSQRAPFHTVHAAFLHHAAVRPDSPAVHDLSQGTGRVVSYRQLSTMALGIAMDLRSRGVAPGSRIPLVVKRGVHMVAGILGILICGAQYIPLDGGVVPDGALRHILDQTGDCDILSLRQFERRFDHLTGRRVIFIDDLLRCKSSVKDPPEQDLPDRTADESFGCYMIYTSGTTGTPKGVHVTHGNVTNLLCNTPGNIGMGPGRRVGQVLSISFDMGAWEILGSLCNGSTLVLRGDDWLETLRQIDILICTPTILSKYDPADFPNIKTVATAGEILPQRIADNWATSGKTLFCGCGPTEVTIVNTLAVHIPGTPVSIGKPTPNNTVYILDGDQNPTPIGDVGLMWAGGKGVTCGYVGLPKLNASKWRPDKFSDHSSFMFNTGDLGRWRADGHLEILGRQDDQVKIKGFRVELDGISASLAGCDGVSAATALLCCDKICAFLQPRSCDVGRVRKEMQALQPYYALPEYYFAVDSFRTTTNGKIDKPALLELASGVLINGAAVAAESVKADGVKDHVSAPSITVAPVLRTLSSSTANADEQHGKLDGELPGKRRSKVLRGIRHRILIVYRRLFSFIWMLNLVVLVIVLTFPSVNRAWLGRLSAVNLTIAVLSRQDFVVNALYTVACSVPKSWPLWFRARCAKIYHFGGVHSGAASAAVSWFLLASVHDLQRRTSADAAIPSRPSKATLATSWLALLLLLLVAGAAWPAFRKAHHNAFELVHRFVGWTALGVLWAHTVLAVNDGRLSTQSLGTACAQSSNVWLLLVSTISIAISWVTLRRVKVETEVLSDHAIRLHFDYVSPVNGSFTRLSERPLLEWHSFATIAAVEQAGAPSQGYSLVVSNAGDWTKRQILNPPRQLWVRGVPTCGVMRIATLFRRVVLVGTGSGIGPLLGFIQKPSCAYKLFWSTPSPEKTFGLPFCDDIRKWSPGAIIHDTRVLGRPDMVQVSYNLAQSFQAEAVIIIANEKITKKVVYGLETRGMPAYGAIWDS